MSGATVLERATSDATGGRRRARADIQALRALAVALVVVYHLWPQRLTGGYVGVDVFFVISGFLITSHLLEAPPRRPRDLLEFWGRRIRRLLPAAFVVLAATLLGVVLLAPVTVWSANAGQVIASAFYVENWALATSSVDYLAADDAATAVQHFWSLSIEEQFYLGWPLLFAAALLLARRLRRPHRWRRIVAVIVAAVAAASFLASLLLSGNDAAAYFLTHTRVWELAAGGILALLLGSRPLRLPGAARSAAAWLGLAAVVASALVFDAGTVFPGVAAALPVLGTALVIAADAGRGPGSPLRLMRLRAVQTAGDLSYGIYLWHWPLIVIAPFALGRETGWVDKLLLIAIAVALAMLTKRFVEDRLRGARPLGRPLRRSFAFAAIGMLLVAALGASVLTFTRAAAAAPPASADGPCAAAAAMTDRACDPHGELAMSPLFAKEDKPAPYADDCWTTGDFTEARVCEYGSDDPGATRVALVGNSHAGQWLPALEAVAEERNWHITTYLIFECYPVDVPIAFPEPARTDGCTAWNERIIPEVAEAGYDLVVTSNRTFRPIEGLDGEASRDAAEAAYGRVLDAWSARSPVLVIREPPTPTTENTPDCVARHLDELGACDDTEAAMRTPDPLADAADRSASPRVRTLDLTEHFCRDGRCYAVIAYYDKTHLTTTLAKSLAEPIRIAAERLMR